MIARDREFKLIGHGVYTIPDAARLSRVPEKRIQRWAKGYWYRYGGERKFSPPIIGIGLEPDDDKSRILQFRDLIEVRFLDAFRSHGVSWKVIRIAATRAKELLETSHPFATRVFRTDGRKILLDMVREGLLPEDHKFLDLVQDQYEWEAFVRPHLLPDEIEFNKQDEPERWWPLGKRRRVVIDPARSFGSPIVHPEGVQTFLLARAVAIEEDAEFVANWYEVPLRSVRDAVEFERQYRRVA